MTEFKQKKAEILMGKVESDYFDCPTSPHYTIELRVDPDEKTEFREIYDKDRFGLKELIHVVASKEFLGDFHQPCLAKIAERCYDIFKYHGITEYFITSGEIFKSFSVFGGYTDYKRVKVPEFSSDTVEMFRKTLDAKLKG